MRQIDADALKELFSEVIGRIAKKPEMNGNLEHMIRASAMVIQMIDDAPSIQPERKTGRWIPTYEDCCADVWVKWKCSECGYVRKKGWKQTYDGAKPDALFCEMCNADMRGDKHETD